MSDELQPGEIALEDDGPADAPAPEPEPAAAAEPEPEPEPTAEPEPEPAAPARKGGGMLAELIEERKARQGAQAELGRITREMAEGRLVRREPVPAAPVADQERAAVQATAERLRLVSTAEDGTQTWDLDAASRVRAEMRAVAAETQAPVQAIVLQNKADANMAAIWAKAAEDGIPAEAMEVVAEQFKGVMAMPNGAQLLAQANVADTIFERGLGLAVRAGKLKAGAAVGGVIPAIKPVVSPATGRRGAGAAGIALSPKMQQLYRDNGLEPSKAHTASTPIVFGKDGSISLED